MTGPEKKLYLFVMAETNANDGILRRPPALFIDDGKIALVSLDIKWTTDTEVPGDYVIDASGYIEGSQELTHIRINVKTGQMMTYTL